MKRLAIGMFDSGIGGLTVLREVRKLLPHEPIVYLGDTARVPYGNRSPFTINRYALENAFFLLSKGIKMLVVACNTSSALSLPLLKKRLPIPVIGVIEPAAREAVRLTRKRKIGVIGTKATIRSFAYTRAIHGIDPSIEVVARPCPLFVPLAEEGLEDDPVAALMAEKYLADVKQAAVDVLVMGCTHYPILERVIQEAVGENVDIINAGRQTAQEVKSLLVHEKSLNRSGRGGCRYFVTDAPDTFFDLGSRFLGEAIPRVSFVKDLSLGLSR